MFQATIIGVNGWAANYLPHLERLEKAGKVKLSAAVVREQELHSENVERLRLRGVRIYLDQGRMHEELHPAIVFIPTGIEFHEPMTLAALEHGCSVLVEKPAAPSVGAVDRMIAARDRRPGCFVAVGFQHIYDRNIHHFKRRFAESLGMPRKITVKGFWPRADKYYAHNDWAGKLHSPRGGLVLDSPANNAFAHFINLALFLCGESFDSSASAEIREASLWRARPRIETFDSCRLNLLTATGVELDIHLSHTVAENFDPMLRVECPHGTVIWQQDSPWQITSPTGESLESGEYGNPIAQMFDDIADRLCNPARFICSLEIAKEHTKVIESLHRDYRIVPVPPDKVRRVPEDGQLIFP
ncbi:MAG: Gfo/Idh/MocA family oxidoreductase [Victivallales bacterium]|nr:Gfo/Idh/MocA family oxidoreductase [Victivallales bacterium]